MEKNHFKSGFVTLIGRPECGKIHFDESAHRAEDSDHIQ